MYGCCGLREERVARPLLDDPAEVHDGDRVGHVADDREVVRDEEVGQVEPVLQVAQQVEDLRLDRDVDGRDRLVEHDELRVERERARDADALALAAGELARIGARVLRAQADELEQLRHARRAAACRESERSWTTSGNETICSTVFRLFSDAYGSWKTICISRRSRRSSRGGRREDVGRVEVDAARGRLVEPEQQPRERRLARAGLADEPDRLAAVEHERDVVDGPDDAAGARGRRAGSAG